MSAGGAESSPHAKARRAAEHMQARLGSGRIDAAVIAGSGLAVLSEIIEGAARIPFASIPGFREAGVAGHRGELVIGGVGSLRVAVLVGRSHLYEGVDAADAALPVRAMAMLGAGVLIVTNAAGAINPAFQVGDLMVIRDQLNLSFRNPLVGQVLPGELRFPDMSSPFDSVLRDLALAGARAAGTPLREGVYAGVLGPSYETPAEVRALRFAGADAVGMSTVPEVITARARGMRVLGVSCLTNVACGLSAEPLAHADVLAATARSSRAVADVLNAVLRDRSISGRAGSGSAEAIARDA
jgi:purine-nucleoside phosphorylase